MISMCLGLKAFRIVTLNGVFPAMDDKIGS